MLQVNLAIRYVACETATALVDLATHVHARVYGPDLSGDERPVAPMGGGEFVSYLGAVIGLLIRYFVEFCINCRFMFRAKS